MTDCNCQRCDRKYEINDAAKAFYDSLNVPEPKQCPPCRSQRRMAWRNERGLYSDNCDLCKKAMISRWKNDSGLTVYCDACWRLDSWDGTQYAHEIDWDKPIYEQWIALINKIPQRSLHITGPEESNENSKYQNCSGDNRNCYLVFNSGYNEDVYYSRGVAYSKDCTDLYFCDQCELCTNNINAKNCYNTHFSQNVNQCSDSIFLRDSKSCKNCIGCTNLHQKEYHIFNESHSKEDYESKLASFELHTSEGLNKFKEEFKKFSEAQIYPASQNVQCENSTGDYLKECKNVHTSFEVTSSEELQHADSTKFCKSSMDFFGYGYYSERIYETVGSSGYQVAFSIACDRSTDIYFCYDVENSSDCFACASLDREKFMIFNKQYSEVEYKEIKLQLIEALKKEGKWGEFPDMSDSLFDYEDSIANDEYPIEMDAEDKTEYEIPDGAKACLACSKAFKTVQQEEKLLNKCKLPLPENCFDCRYKEKTKLRGPRWLSQRTCSNESCENTFKSTFKPEDPRQIYCEPCYLDFKY
jgi:hypothetical protein